MVSVMKVRNVCEALPMGMGTLLREGRRERSRGGDVLVLPYPLVTETDSPRERVLFSAVRDANPFFHLAEAMWMLAGQRDARPLDVFVSDFSSRFAETGGEMHGAYGYRWRSHFMFDQLNAVVLLLQNDETSRQAVLTMWDPSPLTLPRDYGNGNVGEELIGGDDLLHAWKDKPCNTHVYLRVRYEKGPQHYNSSTADPEWFKLLDMTVCCRSNDAVWGAHGANAVHFSILQEYLAARLGLQVGKLVQLSNNYHAYDAFRQVLQRRSVGRELVTALDDNRYAAGVVQPETMFAVPAEADGDVRVFWKWFADSEKNSPSYRNIWFATTLEPMMLAHAAYRRGDMSEAMNQAREVDSSDWSLAAVEWLQRRMSNEQQAA